MRRWMKPSKLSVKTRQHSFRLVRRSIGCRIKRMFRSGAHSFLIAFALIAGVLLLAGCPTPPKKPPRVTALEPLRPVPENTLPTVTISDDPRIESARDRGDSVLPEEKLQLPPGMLQLSEWAKLCGFADVRLLPNTMPQAVELQSQDGILTLVFGQRPARWNGIYFTLGFAPVIQQGQFAVNSLDVIKNIYPLALGTLSISKPKRVLVLDPGHGGSDPGSRGAAKNAVEKDLALDWALRIEAFLTNSSWRVVLTRRDDRDVPLLERVAIADANRADLFISLHFNSLEKNPSGKDESGIETFCLTPVGMPSSMTRSFEDDARRVFPNNQFDAENLLLAMRLHTQVVKATARRDRGVRRARFMTVLREQKRPAALIEGGFLSSPAEASMIMDPAFRQQMAQAVVNALP
jgi:N-acetylmuramoyl-L-alanine amidase